MQNYDQNNRKARTSAFTPQDSSFPQYPTGGGSFPFTGPGGGSGFPEGGSQFPVPYSQPSKPSGSGFNFNEIKGIIDRMGGIDGVIGMVGKVNKVMSTFQQMGPMLKLLLGSFGAKAATTDTDYSAPRRKRRRKKGSAKRKRKSGTRSRKRR